VSKHKRTFLRSDKGRIVRAHLAHYVIGRMEKSGVSLPAWEAKRFDLSVIGVSKASALAELYPKIPLAHLWYNDHGDSPKVYLSWEQYWPVLYNRITYFFRKHGREGGGLLRCVAEWPGTVSEDGLSLIPPPVPQATADAPEDPMPAVPGTGYPEDDPGDPREREPYDTQAPASRGEEVSRHGQD